MSGRPRVHRVLRRIFLSVTKENAPPLDSVPYTVLYTQKSALFCTYSLIEGDDDTSYLSKHLFATMPSASVIGKKD